jgi:DNA-binding IscR family transcriptional regulator
VSVEELAQELGIPPDIVEGMLGALTREGLIAPTDAEPAHFLPARPWEDATLAEALAAVRRARADAGAYTGAPVERAPVQAALDALERATRGAFGATTLKEFATGAARFAAPDDSGGVGT